MTDTDRTPEQRAGRSYDEILTDPVRVLTEAGRRTWSRVDCTAGDVLGARDAVANSANVLEDTRDPLPNWRQEQVMRTLPAGVAKDAGEAATAFATIEQAAQWTRDLRKRFGSYLRGLAQEELSTRHRPQPGQPP